jgi:sarcosine oxidase subunit alpha
MGLAQGKLEGVEVLILAASYSGERAFEIYAPANDLRDVWARLETAIAAEGGGLYGLEALELLRIEKGHIETGAEIDGRRTPGDLDLKRMLRAKGGYVGAPALARPALSDPQRLRFVGLEAVSGAPIPDRLGETLIAASPIRGRTVKVRVAAPVFHDPEGRRYRD